MDFENVLKRIINDFERSRVKYALIGGFALGLWGVVRATADLDFLIDKEKCLKMKDIMRKHKYKCFYEDDNVAQYKGEEYLLGEIDFLYAFRKPSKEMLKRCVVRKIFDNKITIKVLIPEDLIGLKVQAVVNNPSRKSMDWSDIEQLAEANKKNIKWDIIKKHFLLFDLDADFNRLRDKNG
ncbi:MAG: nucleotidyl transferase AbiEii/AbiGii toxin family protein [Candidatus Omnitrophota bacterium]|nr:nucleotidyltransferase family protein [Candidatus Omnitrophota bacterium]